MIEWIVRWIVGLFIPKWEADFYKKMWEED